MIIKEECSETAVGLFASFQRLDGQSVRVEAETSNHAFAGGRNERMMTELFATVYVRQVHFDHREMQRTDAVVQGNARVRIGSGIERHPVDAFGQGLLQAVDEESFDVALIVKYFVVGKMLSQHFKAVFHAVTAVNIGFTLAE